MSTPKDDGVYPTKEFFYSLNDRVEVLKPLYQWQPIASQGVPDPQHGQLPAALGAALLCTGQRPGEVMAQPLAHASAPTGAAAFSHSAVVETQHGVATCGKPAGKGVVVTLRNASGWSHDRYRMGGTLLRHKPVPMQRVTIGARKLHRAQAYRRVLLGDFVLEWQMGVQVY